MTITIIIIIIVMTLLIPSQVQREREPVGVLGCTEGVQRSASGLKESEAWVGR